MVRLLAKAMDRCVTVYPFDSRVQPLTRSTNRWERFFREFRTKSDAIGAVPNERRSLVVVHVRVIRDDAKHDRGRSAKTG